MTAVFPYRSRFPRADRVRSRSTKRKATDTSGMVLVPPREGRRETADGLPSGPADGPIADGDQRTAPFQTRPRRPVPPGAPATADQSA
jgi:hypothetical protein